MSRSGAPLLVSDYGDFARPQLLRETLQSRESRVYCSPDRRHLLVWLRRRLLSFPRLAADTAPPGGCLEHCWPQDSPQLCGLLLPPAPPDHWLLCLVWDNGRVDVWSPPRGPPCRTWRLLHSLELCNSPRARVVALCGGGGELLWCEERGPSKSQGAPSPYMYCICRRAVRVCGEQVALGSMKIILHHSPFYSMLSSSDHIFMIPDSGCHPILIYSLLEDKMTLTIPSTGLLHSKALTEGDFKSMVLEYAGFLTFQKPPTILHSAVTGAGHLLLMTTTGQIYLLHEDGGVRHVCDIDIVDEAQVKMQTFGNILACAVDTTMFLIEINTGRLLAKPLLHPDELFFLRVLETEDVQFLTRIGIYRIGPSVVAEDGERSEPSLLDMVYEEACKYYQRRSLSNTKLTVPELKKGGMFQAPITLSSILNHYQKNTKSKDQTRYTDLLSNMDNELQSFSSLELLKTCIINASAEDMEKYAEELVDHEVTRLLQTDMDRDALLYINYLFATFPKASWTSVRNNFQFLPNGDGKLVIRATAEMWKKVLSPLPPGAKDGSHNGVYPLFEVICQSLCLYKPKWLPTFVQHAQDCSGLSWNYTAKDCDGVPLYKRALSILGKCKENTNVDLEVEILLSSGRPQAIIQAIHILIALQRWSRVMEETRRFSQLSPCITKDIFITLLTEFIRHRHLDPYITQLCDICPDDMTTTDTLRIVLQNLPRTEAEPSPFCSGGGAHLTVGLLKPLLNKVLQNQIRREEKLPAQAYPPAAPRRTNKPVTPSPVLNGGDASPTDFYSTNAL